MSASSLRELARGMVLGATRYVHELLARTDDERAADLWVASEDEQQQIGDPLASLMSRHASVAGVNPDVADLIAVGVAAASWAARNIASAWNLRRARRRMATTTNEPTNAETGEPA